MELLNYTAINRNHLAWAGPGMMISLGYQLDEIQDHVGDKPLSTLVGDYLD